MDERVREALLDCSDARACRRVWEAETGGGEADLADYVEALRHAGGDVALVTSDGAAEVYARWDGGYERLSFWPPWTLGSVERLDRGALLEALARTDDPRVVPHAETPFACGPITKPGNVQP